MQNKDDSKINLLCENIKKGKYNNSFLKIKIDNKGYIVSFTREVSEDLKKGDVKDE